jgi:hypothetical protein
MSGRIVRRQHSRLGLVLVVLGLVLAGLSLSINVVTAQESDDTAPVIGADPADDSVDGATTEDPDSETVTASAEGEVVAEVVSDELAATGWGDSLLASSGFGLILVGFVMTLVGQPAPARGRHSRPTSKLKSSFFGLMLASIGESLGSARGRTV